MTGGALARGALAALVLLAQPALAAAPENDYPTAARADYVLACLSVNGGTQAALVKCACSIDVIATVLPYADYERADTVLRMRKLGGGYLAGEFRVAEAEASLRRLEEAQAEAEMRCF